MTMTMIALLLNINGFKSDYKKDTDNVHSNELLIVKRVTLYCANLMHIFKGVLYPKIYFLIFFFNII